MSNGSIMRRLLANLSTGTWHARRAVPRRDRETITEAVRDAERRTSAQIKVVVEASLHITDVIRGQTARERALEVFGLERVWDTRENNGILLYVLLSEHAAEVVVDRGFNDIVSDQEWQRICSILEHNAKQDGLGQAIVLAVKEVAEIALKHFPPSGGPNELPDEVRVR